MKKRVFFLFIIFFCYLVTLLFPRFLFDKKTTYRNYVLYSDQEKDLVPLETIDQKLRQSEIYNQKDHQIFLVHDPRLYFFLTLSSPNTFGASHPLTNNIFINVSRWKNPERRTVSGVIVHELVHNFLESHLSLLSYFLLDDIINEGYCDYISGETSLRDKEGFRLYCKNEDSKSIKIKYFKAYYLTKFLIDDKKMPISNLLKLKNYSEYEKELRSKLCSFK